jgi:hypothetical protein
LHKLFKLSFWYCTNNKISLKRKKIFYFNQIPIFKLLSFATTCSFSTRSSWIAPVSWSVLDLWISNELA